MKSMGTYVVVGTGVRHSDKTDKDYYSVVLEQDGDVMTFNTDAETLSGVQKYKPHDVIINFAEFKGELIARVVSITPVK